MLNGKGRMWQVEDHDGDPICITWTMSPNKAPCIAPAIAKREEQGKISTCVEGQYLSSEQEISKLNSNFSSYSPFSFSLQTLGLSPAKLF